MIVHNVEQGSDEWFELRAGMPTASEAGKLITGTGKKSTQITDFAYQLAGELYAGMPLDRWEGNSSTDRGKELEADARIAYEQETGVWTEQVGFCTADDSLYGCSPDGLIGNDGMVEIKCLSAKHHVKNMVYYNKHKKIMPDYIPQTQMQLLVCERQWCDLAFYHPDLPILIVRQLPDMEIHDVLIKQLKLCIETRDSALEIINTSQQQSY